MPKRIIGFYNVEQNYALFRLTSKPVNRHLSILDADIETTQADIVETILADRYHYDKRDSEWYKVRTGDVIQNRWMAHVTAGYKELKESKGAGGYAAYHRVSQLKGDDVDDRPVCGHGFPCEIHYSEYGREMYFDCPVKYVWPDLLPGVERIPCCDFRQVVPKGSWAPLRNSDSLFLGD